MAERVESGWQGVDGDGSLQDPGRVDGFVTRERAVELARRWTTCADRSVQVDVEVTEVDGGYLVDVVVYRGRGPFERIGGTVAVIDHAGRITVLDPAA